MVPTTTQPVAFDGFAISGLVFGIVAIVVCWMSPVNAIASLTGVVLSSVGLAKANRIGVGKGLSIAGLVCNLLAFTLTVGVTLMLCELGSAWSPN